MKVEINLIVLYCMYTMTWSNYNAKLSIIRSWNERYIFSLDMDRHRWIVPILYVFEINIIHSFIHS